MTSSKVAVLSQGQSVLGKRSQLQTLSCQDSQLLGDDFSSEGQAWGGVEQGCASHHLDLSS